MKTKIIYLLCVFLLTSIVHGQENSKKSEIKTTGRFTQTGTIELRFFPNNRQVLAKGFTEGLVLERSTSEKGKYETVGKVKVFSEELWQEAIAQATSESDREDLDLAHDFYLSILNPEGGSFSFDKGLAEMKNVKQAEDMEYGILVLTAIKNPKVAEALGLSYIDTAVKGEKTYWYKVALASSDKTIEVESVVSQVSPINSKEYYQNKVYTKPGDTELSFVWASDGKLSGYFVERALPGTQDFKPMNSTPIYSLYGKNYTGTRYNSFGDTKLTNYLTYTYRFSGYNAFGEIIRFAEVAAMPIDLTPPQKPFLKQPEHTKPDEVTVSWEMNRPIASDFKGFAVARSDENKGTFEVIHDKLLPKDTRKFIDKTFKKGKTNYYVVQALDTSNNVSSSYPVSVTLIDSIAPHKPVFVSGKIDSLGIVTLKVEKNKEPDLMGYRLFRANAPEHEFSVIKEAFDDNDTIPKPMQLVYNDTVTLNSLTPYIYYRIKALDYNYNQSEFSEILKVKRPDTIPPSPAVFKYVKVGTNDVLLTFALSKSKDVVKQILYRKDRPEDSWKEYQLLENDQKTFTDKKVEQGKTYYYTLRAQDDAGLFSDYAIPVQAKPYDNGVRPPVENLRVSEEKKQAMLSWKYDSHDKETYYVIYKKDTKGNFREFKSTTELRAIDQDLKKKQEYAVKVFTKDGGQSKLSNSVILKIE